MGNISCPYCREEIKADAVLCRYCHSRLRSTLTEKVLWAIGARLASFSQVEGYPFDFENPRCELLCKKRYKDQMEDLSLTDEGRKVVTNRLRECLEECTVAEAIAKVAEDLSRELIGTYVDIVWEYSGRIDPVPFEAAVRERFSRPRGK